MLSIGTVLVGRDPIHVGSSARVVKVLKDKSVLIWTVKNVEPYPPMTYSNFVIMNWIKHGQFYIQPTKKLEEYM